MPLATTGVLIEVTPWDELQYWSDESTPWELVDDRTPFRFRVAGELVDANGFLFGLFGPVESGPKRYENLICSILLRYDNSDWCNESESGAGFRVAPTVAQRTPGYDAAAHSDVPFYLHPEGTCVTGHPRISRFGGIRVIDESQLG